jgi:hypothetical protein
VRASASEFVRRVRWAGSLAVWTVYQLTSSLDESHKGPSSGLYSSLQEGGREVSANIDEAPLTTIIGVMWALTVIGFLLSLVGTRSAPKA